jgi:hypothetical protein
MVDLASAAAATATVVGLLSEFIAHRKSHQAATFDEFQAWLAEHRHEDVVALLKSNEKVSIGLKALFNESSEKILAKLDALDAALAMYASRVAGFAEVAAAVRPSSVLSEQALMILRRMRDGGTSKVLHHSRGMSYGGIDLVAMDGSAGTIEPTEQQFIEDDLRILVALGLLRISLNPRGHNLYHYTRAAQALLAAMS